MKLSADLECRVKENGRNRMLSTKKFAARRGRVVDQTYRTGFLLLYFQHSNFHGKLCHDFGLYFCFRLLRLKKIAPVLGLDKILHRKTPTKMFTRHKSRSRGMQREFLLHKPQRFFPAGEPSIKLTVLNRAENFLE